MANSHSDTAAEKSGGSIFPSLNAVSGTFAALGVIGAVGVIGAAVMGGAGSTQSTGVHLPALGLLLQSYTYGYIFWLMLSLGCLGIQIITNSIRATWGVSILRVAEAGASNLWVLFFLGLPLVASLWCGNQIGYHLYAWTNPDVIAHDPIVIHKLAYMNPTAVTIRYVLFFIIWIYYNWYLAYGPKGTLKQDQTFDNAISQERVNVASPGIVVYALTMTFFTTDFLMSLDPHWFSTIYGIWWCVVACGLCTAVGTVFITTFHDKKPYDQIVTPALTKDLGNMMFVFTMLFGYASVSQVLIYWSGNLPENVVFYYDRFKGDLAYLGFAIVIGQFFTPFLLLLSGRTKRTPHMLRNVAIWIITIRVIDFWYQIEPFFHRTLTDVSAIAVDFATWALVGGIWVGLFIHQFKKHSPLIEHDRRLQEAKANAGHH